MSHLSVQKKNLDNFFRPALLRSKTNTNSESSIDEKMYFLWFLNKGSIVIFFSFSSAVFISLHFPFICVPIFSFRPTFCFTNPDGFSLLINPDYRGFTIDI
jgi:hypothetical protein